MNHLLYIIANLTWLDNLKAYFVEKTDLASKLLEFLPLKSPNYVRRILLWNISNIIYSYSLKEKEFILETLNEDYLKSSDSKRNVLMESLIIIHKISRTSDEIILELLYNYKIHETVMTSFKAISETMEKEDILLQIKLAKIVSNLTVSSRDNIKVILLIS